MAYAAPTIGPGGLTISGYPDIINFFTAGFQGIFGATVYLGNDSADFQLLSIIALAAADLANAIQLDYNNKSPVTAIGSALDTDVAYNGLARKAATNSTCNVTLSGTPDAVITDGVCVDVNGNLWDLPATVTIGGGGTVAAVVTAEQAGAINALANQITGISTPQAGWTSVTNGSSVASVGQPVETDAELRARQAVSTELPSETIAAGTIAALLAVPGVTRVNDSPVLGSDGTPSYENFTGSTDDWGNPAHSISFVVEGGTDLDVATAIYNNRGLGPLTNGSTGGTHVAEPVTDPNSGVTITMNFARPTSVPIFAIINVHVIAGGTLNSAQNTAIQTAVANYINGLQIGGVVSFGEMVAAAAGALNVNPEQPLVSVRTPFFFGTSASPSTSTDVPMNFYQVAQGIVDNVHISVTSV